MTDDDFGDYQIDDYDLGVIEGYRYARESGVGL
jgi:hypothetical protein